MAKQDPNAVLDFPFPDDHEDAEDLIEVAAEDLARIAFNANEYEFLKHFSGRIRRGVVEELILWSTTIPDPDSEEQIKERARAALMVVNIINEFDLHRVGVV